MESSVVLEGKSSTIKRRLRENLKMVKHMDTLLDFLKEVNNINTMKETLFKAENKDMARLL